MTTQSFPADSAKQYIGTPMNAPTGMVTILMKTNRYYTDGTLLKTGISYSVTTAWAKTAVDSGWAADVPQAFPEIPAPGGLTAAQVSAVQALVSGAVVVTGPASPTVDIFDMYKATERRTLTLPNPYSAVGSDMVHPSVVYVPGGGWGGWRYWMAYTPYPTANSAYENPCVAVSQDGETWQALSSMPLVGSPANGYNADTHLALAPDKSCLYLIYRERLSSGTTGNNVRVMESADGRTWSAPVTILSGAYNSQDYACPSVWYDATNARWVMVSHNLDGGSTYPMQRNVSSGPSIYTGWSAPSSVTMTNPTGGRTWWHSCFLPLADGRIIGLVQDIVNGGGGASGALFAAESLDGGLTFAVRSVYPEIAHYRPAISLYQRDDGVVGISAWIGLLYSGPTYSITREDWLPGAALKTISDAMTQIAAFGTYPATVLWFDTFNRADGALGTPLVGAALTVDAGTITIVSNRAQTGSVGNNRGLTATLGTADYSVGVDVSLIASAVWLIFRAVDTSNFYRIGFQTNYPSALTVQSIVSGSVGALNRSVVAPARAGFNITAACRLVVVCRGRRFRIYVNGVLWEEIADTLYFSTGVKVGFQATNASSAFDNLLVLS